MRYSPVEECRLWRPTCASRLVLKGRSYNAQRYALVMLLMTGAPRDGERIQRIRREHPDDRIRKLLDEGLQPPPHPGMGPR